MNCPVEIKLSTFWEHVQVRYVRTAFRVLQEIKMDVWIGTRGLSRLISIMFGLKRLPS